MRFIFLLLTLFILSCNNAASGKKKMTDKQEDSKALSIVKASIDAHGGMDHWKKIKHFKFRKETSLFHSDGSIEKDVNEIHTIHQQDTLYGTIENITSSPENEYTIKFADGTGKKYAGAKTSDATNSFLSSHFVVNQPFKLLDPGIELTYQGRDTLSNGKIVDVVKAYYGSPDDDIWWFYFDIDNHMLCANLIFHSPTYAYVDNEVTEVIDGIPWNLKRTTYRTDSLRNIEFVRAKFLYEVLETGF